MQFTRGGPLSPALLVSLLLFQAVKGADLGYGRMLESFWDQGAALGLELPQHVAAERDEGLPGVLPRVRRARIGCRQLRRRAAAMTSSSRIQCRPW